MAERARTASQPWPRLALDDDAYREMAAETRDRIDWDRVVQDDAEPWKWLANARNFSLYTKHVGAFRVLSTGVISGSVHEVATLLLATSQCEFTHKMAALHDRAFKAGSYIADIEDARDGYQLSVRSATFSNPSWRRRDEEWCFLDAAYYNRDAPRLEKLLTTLQPHHGQGIVDRKRQLREPKHLRNAIAGYLVTMAEATDAPTKPRGGSVRVQFYAEVPTPQRSVFGGLTKRDGPENAVQSRLVQLGRDCDRLAQLVRRRRLGIQVLIDQTRVLPAIHARCIQCDEVVLIAKLCRICGHSVCGDCSDKYERETQIRLHDGDRTTTTRLETIRVCDPCLLRVDRGDYSCMSDAALAGPTVAADPGGKNSVPTSAAVDLKQLLQDALLETQTPERKRSVLNVIRSLLDQERSPSVSAPEAPEPKTLDAAALEALDHLVLPNIPVADIQLAGQSGRTYTLTKVYESQFTATENEAARLQTLETFDVLSSAPCEELDIICDLAAKEVGAFASIVSIVTADAMRVVAANNPSFKVLQAERAHSFCTHTIMDDKPLIIPNPEADVRVNYTKVATTLGARFYCGFPLVLEGNNVVGTLCCLDRQKHELTETQFTAMQRLADTAAKIIHVRGDQRRRNCRTETA